MPEINSYKSKQFLFLLIKLSIVFGACYFIYIRFTNNDQLHINDFWNMLQSNYILSFRNSSMLISLSILNWFFEILKWKNITLPVKKISFKDSLQQSLGSLTASLFTPNRIGEYGAKALFFEKNLRKKITVITLVNNVGQMLITLFFGLLGLFFFTKDHPINIVHANLYFLIGLLIFSAAILILYQKNFKIGSVSLERLKKFLKTISKILIFKNIGFAFLRYFIFSHQFYFLIHILNPQIPYLELMAGITTFYLMSSIIPMLFIFDVVVKNGIAVWIFSFLGLHELAIMTTVTLMWLLNFVIPSLFGSYFILNFRFYTPTKVINNKV